MTLLCVASVWFYPALLEAWVSRWGENAAKRAPVLARAGRLEEAEASLARAAEREKVWIDAKGRQQQRVYLGSQVWIDHRDFVDAAQAFLDAKNPEAARRAAWEAIWRYHAVNRAGEIPEPWRILSEASRVLDDEDSASEARRIADAWNHSGTREPFSFPMQSASDEEPSEIANGQSPMANPDLPIGYPQSAIPNRQSAMPPFLPPAAFHIERGGRFNPSNKFKARAESLLFDEPCIVTADVAFSSPAVSLRFEARSVPAYGWRAIVVIEMGGQRRFRLIDSPDWSLYEVPLKPPVPERPILRIAYLNHGAEGVGEELERRTLEIRRIHACEE